MSTANELLTAIHALLSEDAELTAMIGPDAIRDRLVAGRKLPCIVVGELTSNDYSTSTEEGEEHLLALEIWSDAAGRRQVQTIVERLHALLQDAALGLATHHLVGVRHLATRTRREPKTRLHVAEMRFRAVTEPAA
ncbi:hypothetical protein A6U87_04065 [Rhizobium sp. AC44/96]|uniref:DUF3168 domain-containing protein n=1 Tax=Rhizobium sp. AC44/96 TaxID=1841654 RepID=UPI00080F950C|nr:DUF3168 domain-containing protein [Rhizobium sp. AC44/96]OCJ18090.1 hypothetical protein A6U87_04065 [Rhizobium sp. AC44/96]